MISWDDFVKVDMRVGRIIAVDAFPEARKPAYRLQIDFGALGVKQSSAQITNYSVAELLNRQVVAVINFPPKQVGPFRSEVLVLGAIEPDGAVLLLEPKPGASLGSRIA
ncbi:MAG: tRNA-binding protein [Chloroflexi bacterium]|jgi:tRNA-binding protein|nr:MAG: tRNA-binding protein [Chloroflexota bacterium]